MWFHLYGHSDISLFTLIHPGKLSSFLLSLLHHSCFSLLLSEILFSSLEHLWWLYSSGTLILSSLIWLKHIPTCKLVGKLPGCRYYVLLIFYPPQISLWSGNISWFWESNKQCCVLLNFHCLPQKMWFLGSIMFWKRTWDLESENSPLNCCVILGCSLSSMILSLIHLWNEGYNSTLHKVVMKNKQDNLTSVYYMFFCKHKYYYYTEDGNFYVSRK